MEFIYGCFTSLKDYKNFVYIETEKSIFLQKYHMQCWVQQTRQREIEFLLFLNNISFSSEMGYWLFSVKALVYFL